MSRKTIAFIPARGGSKSIPHKNIKLFCGKPLIYWNIAALHKVDEIDEIIVATDSADIMQVVKSFNLSKVVIYERDPVNAQDTSSTESVMLEYIDRSHLDDDIIFILVQATSPLTSEADYKNALNYYKDSSCESLLSAVKVKNFYWRKDGSPVNYDYRRRPRRQDFEGFFQENGAFYINSVKNIRRDHNRLSEPVGVYEMPEYTSFEIDEPDDWMICESLMRKHILNKKSFNGIKLFLTDVDGVLTDAGMYYSEKGDELKKFNTLDGKGFELLRNAGIKTGIITSENTEIVKRRAEKLKVDYLFQGITNKLEIASRICVENSLTLDEVAYIGDDLNDTELLKHVGLAAVPLNSIEQNRNIPGIILLKKKGGEGVVREFIDDYILTNCDNRFIINS